MCRALNIFQVYQYFTIYSYYFFIKHLIIFMNYLYNSLYNHFKQVKVIERPECDLYKKIFVLEIQDGITRGQNISFKKYLF
jgi:hypothetical protein